VTTAPTFPPSQTMDTSHSYDGPGPSGTVPHASLQHSSGRPHGSCHNSFNEGCQEVQTSQALPPRRQTSLQQVHMSPLHLSASSSTPTPSPQSQPQRPLSITRSSLTPRIPTASLPPNKMPLRDHSASINRISPPDPAYAWLLVSYPWPWCHLSRIMTPHDNPERLVPLRPYQGSGSSQSWLCLLSVRFVFLVMDPQLGLDRL
jgi:hypothetical protein